MWACKHCTHTRGTLNNLKSPGSVQKKKFVYLKSRYYASKKEDSEQRLFQLWPMLSPDSREQRRHYPVWGAMQTNVPPLLCRHLCYPPQTVRYLLCPPLRLYGLQPGTSKRTSFTIGGWGRAPKSWTGRDERTASKRKAAVWQPLYCDH